MELPYFQWGKSNAHGAESLDLGLSPMAIHGLDLRFL